MKKSILILLGVVLSFFAVAVFFFQADVIGGKEVPQSDVVQFEGMSRWPKKFHQETGESPLWNEGMFSGMPNYLLNARTDTWLNIQLRQLFTSLIPNSSLASALLLTMLCFGVLLWAFKVRWQLVLIGSVVYAFNTYNILLIEVGHMTKIWAIAFAALVIAGMHLTFRKKYWLGIALFITGLVMELRSEHIQITYYLIFVCLIYVISEAYFYFKENEIKELVRIGSFLLIASLIAGGTMTAKLLINQEYARYSTRGKAVLSAETNPELGEQEEGLDKDYAFSWSQGKMETITLLVPYFYGGGSAEKLNPSSEVYELFEVAFGKDRTDQLSRRDQLKVPMYYGDQPGTAGPLYAGAITCFLFVLGLVLLPAREKYWVLAAALLCMFFAWGRNLAFFNYFLFDYFPLFNKFRSVSMALSLTLILMPLLGFRALDQFISQIGNRPSEELQKILIRATGIVIGVLVVALFYSFAVRLSTEKDLYYAQQYFGQEQRLVNDFVDALQDDRAGFLRYDVFRSAGLILVVALSLWALLFDKVKLLWVFVTVGVLAVGDVWLVGKRYLYDAKFKPENQIRSHRKTAADAEILKDKDPHYRVFNLQDPFNEAYTSYYHKSIGGYFAAKLRRYYDLINYRLSNEREQLITKLRSGELDFSDLYGLNMLNAKYFKFGDEAQAVIQNDAALGNAWFVEDVVSVNSPDEAIVAIGVNNPAQKAVINTSEFDVKETSFAVDSSASIRLTSFNTLELKYQSDNANNGLVVFSEIFYPKDWKATIDGKEVPILRANYVLRALQVPAGKHEIVFTCQSETLDKGLKVAEISSVLFVLLALGGFGMALFQRIREEKEETN